MPIEFRCTQCNRLLRTGDDTAGRQARCPECGAILTVPAPGAPPEAAMPPPTAARQSPFGPATPPAVSGEPVNPYESPRGFGGTSPESAYQPYGSVDAYAAARVAAPATGLLVTGSIGLALQILATAINLLGLAMPPNARDAEFLMLSGGMSVFFGALGMVVAVVIIMGPVASWGCPSAFGPWWRWPTRRCRPRFELRNPIEQDWFGDRDVGCASAYRPWHRGQCHAESRVGCVGGRHIPGELC